MGICDVWGEFQWDYAKLRWGKRWGGTRGPGAGRAVCRRVWLCADSGQPSGLSDPALSLTCPDCSVFSFNPVVPLCAPPHSSSLLLTFPWQCCRGARPAAGQSVSWFEARDQHQLRLQVARQLASAACSEHGEWGSAEHIWSRAAHTAWDTAWCCPGVVGASVSSQKQLGRGASICVNCSKAHARSADVQEVPDLGLSTRQAENEPLTESLRRKWDGSCFLVLSYIYFHYLWKL